MASILVVDDEDQIRGLIRVLFHRAGHSVSEAANGSAALRYIQHTSSDLVITDIVMPDMDGLELIREIKKIHPAQKVLAISGGGRNQPGLYLQVAKRFGANDILFKPFGTEQILKAATALLST